MDYITNTLYSSVNEKSIFKHHTMAINNFIAVAKLQGTRSTPTGRTSVKNIERHIRYNNNKSFRVTELKCAFLLVVLSFAGLDAPHICCDSWRLRQARCYLDHTKEQAMNLGWLQGWLNTWTRP